jgi:hypothetical protein
MDDAAVFVMSGASCLARMKSAKALPHIYAPSI